MPSIREDMVIQDRFLDDGEFDPDKGDAACDAITHILEWIEASLAMRLAGLIYFYPLCHDGVDY